MEDPYLDILNDYNENLLGDDNLEFEANDQLLDENFNDININAELDIKSYLTSPSHASTQTTDLSNYNVNREHVKLPIIEIYTEINLDISSTKLITMLQSMDITDDVLVMWIEAGYGTFDDKQSMEQKLELLVDYAENSIITSPGIKQKLRFITKLLLEDDTIDKIGILSLLASHGGVCNVMKEVGIQLSYSLVTNSLKENYLQSAFEQCLLRCLRFLRQSCIENTFAKSGYAVISYGNLNQHHLIKFSNLYAPYIGLQIIPDPNPAYNNQIRHIDLESFYLNYNANRIIDFIELAMNDIPRKISYSVIIKWFKNNTIGTDKYKFLGCVCDINNGKFKNEWIKYMLSKLNIIVPNKEIDWIKIYEQNLS